MIKPSLLFWKPTSRLPEIQANEHMIPYFVNAYSTKMIDSVLVFVYVASIYSVMMLTMVLMAQTGVTGSDSSVFRAFAGAHSVAAPALNATNLHAHHHATTFAMVPFLLLYIPLLMISPLYIATQVFLLPQYVQMTGKGINLHWLGKMRWSTPLIPWYAVNKITVEDRVASPFFVQGMHSVNKTSFFRVRNFADEKRLRKAFVFTCNLKALQPNWFAILCLLAAKSAKMPKDVFEVALFLEGLQPAEKQELAAACQEYVPESCGDLELLQPNEAVPQYTTLWLHALERSGQEIKPLDSGTVLSGPKRKYKIDTRVGSGGQALTYAASIESNDVHNGSVVILKEFFLPTSGGLEITEKAIANIRKEYDLIQTLDHPQIVKCTDFFVSGRRAYLAMNLISGRTLRSVVEGGGRMQENEVLGLAQQMCEILEYLHTRAPAVVHRDFTPDNLILTDDGTLVLIDFNVAKRLESDSATMTAVGRHCYIPMEQFQGRASARSDIYAMGCTLYYLLTGEEPEPITPSNVHAHRADVSDFMQELVLRATAKKEANRYADAGEILAEIKSHSRIELPKEAKVVLE